VCSFDWKIDVTIIAAILAEALLHSARAARDLLMLLAAPGYASKATSAVCLTREF
jgi:hypothetical protein